MKIRKLIVTTFIAAMMLIGISAAASADGTTTVGVDISATAPAPICSLTMTVTSSNPTITWNGSSWPTGVYTAGTLDATINSTGAPGHQDCTVSAASNSDFIGVNHSETLLDADALLFNGYTMAQVISYYGLNVPVTAPQSLSGIVLTINATSANLHQSAQPDTYTSTISLTFAAVP